MGCSTSSTNYVKGFIMSQPRQRKFEIKAQKDSAEIWLYEDIGEGWFGGISAKKFADELKAAGDVKDIYVRINSVGGNVFDGIAMYNSLKRHQAHISVSIDGIAASIASVIAMAGDKIDMAENASMMIHDPWTLAFGSAPDLRKQADELDKIRDNIATTYQAKSSLDADRISGMMAEETWMTASEALDFGFVDTLTDVQAIAASANNKILSQFNAIPEKVLERINPKSPDLREQNREKLAKMQKFYSKRKW